VECGAKRLAPHSTPPVIEYARKPWIDQESGPGGQKCRPEAGRATTLALDRQGLLIEDAEGAENCVLAEVPYEE
jgi:hypothetical protein